MDKNELIDLIYEFVEKNKYDKRFLPFFESYITKCAYLNDWDGKNLVFMLDNYAEKIKQIKFINIGKKRIEADIENNIILMDERIKYALDNETLNEYIEASYKEQDKILGTNISEKVDIYEEEPLREEIKYIFKIYNKNLMREKIAYEVIMLLQQKEYNKTFIPFIKEYFYRSAQIYNWNKDELEKKISNFKNSVDSIELKALKNKCAQYFPKEKAIYINKNVKSYSNEIIIKNIFREFGHASNYTKIDNKVYENGLYTVPKGSIDEKMLNEYAEEVAANYLTGRVPYSNYLYTTCRVSQNDRKDYNNKIAYLASMFSAAFGISEFEIAKLKDKGRARFEEYFRARFEYMDTTKYINEFFSIVANVQNAKDGAFSTKEISEQYAKMYNLSIEILNNREEYESKNTDINNKRINDLNINYARYKIVDTFKQAKRNQCLERKVLNSIINDRKYIHKYSRISKLNKYRFKKIAKEIHKNSDTTFDNNELSHIIFKDIKYPIFRQII